MAAMEPVLGGRDDAAGHVPVLRPGYPPQWSPSLADGTTPPDVVRTEILCQAAMEPVLGGRDDARNGIAG